MKIETITFPPQPPKTFEYVSMSQDEWHMLIDISLLERKSIHNIQFLDESYVHIGGRKYQLNIKDDDSEKLLQRAKAKQDKVKAWFDLR